MTVQRPKKYCLLKLKIVRFLFKGPFTKDARDEGGRGVPEIRTNSDIGRGVLFNNPDVRV